MASYTVTNPATGAELRRYDEISDEGVASAVEAADTAFRTWSDSTSVADRADLLRAVARLYREQREELAELIVVEMGKVREGALGEVDFAADIIEYYADNGHRQVTRLDSPWPRRRARRAPRQVLHRPRLGRDPLPGLGRQLRR